VADAWRDKQKGFHLAQSNKVPGCRLVKTAAQVKGAKSLELRYQKKTRVPFILDKVVKSRGLIKILPHAEPLLERTAVGKLNKHSHPLILMVFLCF